MKAHHSPTTGHHRPANGTDSRRVAAAITLTTVAAVTGLAALTLLGMTACDSKSSSESRADGRLEVVTTVGMLADMTRAIGGDCVSVEALMGPGVDPHIYRASAGDVDTLRNAELIVYLGLNLEGSMADVLEEMGRRVATLSGGSALDTDRLLPFTGYPGHHDPHVWMDASMWVDIIPAVEAEIGTHRPNCKGLEQRAQEYTDDVNALHDWAHASMATVPIERRVMVTAHDAFSYFGRAYDVEVRPIQGVSTEAEAGVADIQDTASFIVQRQIPAIFVESSVNPANIEAVRGAVRDRGGEVSLGRQLFSDAMGDDGTWSGTYIGMIRHNVLSLVEALGGQPAPWPKQLAGWRAQWSI